MPQITNFDTNYLISALKNKTPHIGEIPVDIITDKAFDTVQHNILLDKMYNYGIRGCIHDWFQSYLCNRHHQTIANNALSPNKQVSFGVPQGSILGHILFLLYIFMI